MQQQQQRGTERAEQAANIARRRAAHFARFEDAGESREGNVHSGGDEARTLGPWSSAVELVNARQRAAAERSEKILEAARRAGDQEDTTSWEPSRDPSLGPRPGPSRALTLMELSLRLLVAHINDVVSLWGVPDAIKAQLAAAVCARRAMSPEAALLFAEHAPCEVVLPNCTELDQEAMQKLLLTACSARLERLELGCCGRGLTDATARAIIAAAAERGAASAASGNGGSAGGSGSGGGGDASCALPALRTLALQGAYNLSDGTLCDLLRLCPGLRRLGLPQGSKLDGSLLLRLPELAPCLEEIDLSECRGIPGSSLTSSLPQLMGLRRVTLDGISEVDDSVLEALSRLPSLSSLSIAFCQSVSDKGIFQMASRSPNLEKLNIDDCARVGDEALAAVARGCPRLSHLSARRCTKLTDAGLSAVADRGALRRLAIAGVPGAGAGAAAALARRCGATLESLDASFCRGIPEASLGALLDGCGRLSEVRLYGCTQVTGRVVHGHSNDGPLVLVGLATSVKDPGPAAPRQ